MEAMCRHQEKHAAFQQSGKEKQSASCPVIANAVKQSMQVHRIASLHAQRRMILQRSLL
jgi:hypothetical protein